MILCFFKPSDVGKAERWLFLMECQSPAAALLPLRIFSQPLEIAASFPFELFENVYVLKATYECPDYLDVLKNLKGPE